MQAKLLEPGDQREADDGQRGPGGVGVPVGERHAGEAGVFEAFDGVLDAGVFSGGAVEFDGVAYCVAEKTPIAPVRGVEQSALRAGVQRLASHDQPGACWPSVEVGVGGELGDLGAAGSLFGVFGRGSPHVGIGAGRGDGRADRFV